MIKPDIYWMTEALGLAQTAKELGEVPVGALIIKDNRLVSTGYNLRESLKNSIVHAELIAIDSACKALGMWRLEDCTLYCTLEPCPMCAGAIINARISRVVYGASDPKSGCYGSLVNFNDLKFNHTPEITSGVLAEESGNLLKNFFKDLRKQNN